MRLRAPKAEPGEIKVRWGREDRYDGPDVVVAWGDGVPSSDASLVHSVLCNRRYYPAGIDKPLGMYRTERSFVDEMEARGYDITTLRVSIRKKKQAA